MMVRLTQYIKAIKGRQYQSKSGFNMAVMQQMCDGDIKKLLTLLESFEMALDDVEVAIMENHANDTLAKADLLHCLQNHKEAINELIDDKDLVRWGEYESKTEPEATQDSSNGQSQKTR